VGALMGDVVELLAARRGAPAARPAADLEACRAAAAARAGARRASAWVRARRWSAGVAKATSRESESGGSLVTGRALMGTATLSRLRRIGSALDVLAAMVGSGFHRLLRGAARPASYP